MALIFVVVVGNESFIFSRMERKGVQKCIQKVWKSRSEMMKKCLKLVDSFENHEKLANIWHDLSQLCILIWTEIHPESDTNWMITNKTNSQSTLIETQNNKWEKIQIFIFLLSHWNSLSRLLKAKQTGPVVCLFVHLFLCLPLLPFWLYANYCVCVEQAECVCFFFIRSLLNNLNLFKLNYDVRVRAHTTA